MLPRRHIVHRSTTAAFTRTIPFQTFSSELQTRGGTPCICCFGHITSPIHPVPRLRRRVRSAPFSTSLWWKKDKAPTESSKVDECESPSTAIKAYESNLDDVLRSLATSTISPATAVRGFSWQRGETGKDTEKRESPAAIQSRLRSLDRRRSASNHSTENREQQPMRILLPGQLEPINMYRRFTALFRGDGTHFDAVKQNDVMTSNDAEEGKLHDGTETLYAENILQVLDTLDKGSSTAKESTTEGDVYTTSATTARKRPALEWAELIKNARDLETVENLERELVVVFSDFAGLPGTTTTTTTVTSTASLPPKLLARRRRIRFLLNSHLLETYIRFRDVSGAKRAFERIRVYALWGKKNSDRGPSGDLNFPVDDTVPNATDRAETVPATHLPVLTRAYHSYIEALLRVGTGGSLKEATLVLREASEFGLDARTGRDFATEILLLSRTRDVDRLELSWKRMEESGCEVSLIAYGAYAGCMSDAGRIAR